MTPGQGKIQVAFFEYLLESKPFDIPIMLSLNRNGENSNSTRLNTISLVILFKG